MSRSNPDHALILADGCFDPLHVGHLAYLRVAARLGDELVVNVAGDDVIRAKGRQPFQLLQERMDLIRALPMVSRVVSKPTLRWAIEDLRPAVLVKGGDWKGRLPADVLTACERHNVSIVYTDTVGRSSAERLAS